MFSLVVVRTGVKVLRYSSSPVISDPRGSKAMIRLLVTLMFLSMGMVLYPQDVRSQTRPYSTPAAPDRYCAKPTKETEPPDCSFANMKDCRASLKAKGGGRCYKQ